MNRFVIAATQSVGIGLIIAAAWHLVSMWVALGLLGLLLVVGATGAERATLDR